MQQVVKKNIKILTLLFCAFLFIAPVHAADNGGGMGWWKKAAIIATLLTAGTTIFIKWSDREMARIKKERGVIDAFLGSIERNQRETIYSAIRPLIESHSLGRAYFSETDFKKVLTYIQGERVLRRDHFKALFEAFLNADVPLITPTNSGYTVLYAALQNKNLELIWGLKLFGDGIGERAKATFTTLLCHVESNGDTPLALIARNFGDPEYFWQQVIEVLEPFMNMLDPQCQENAKMRRPSLWQRTTQRVSRWFWGTNNGATAPQ